MPKQTGNYSVKEIREQLRHNAIYGDAVEALTFLMKEYDKLEEFQKNTKVCQCQ